MRAGLRSRVAGFCCTCVAFACGSRTGLELYGGANAAPSTIASSPPASSPPAPRPIAPLSTATVTSQSPMFHWVLAPGDDGAQLEICANRPCSSVIETLTSASNSGAPSRALTQGTYFWRVRGTRGGIVGTQPSPVWEFNVGARSAPVNTSWGGTLDVNGDGFPDVVVGADSDYAVASQPVLAYLYLGSASGPSTTPTTALKDLDGSTDGANNLYVVVASAGDVNGDGYGDLVVATNDRGKATSNPHLYLYLGGASGLSPTPSALTVPAANEAFADFRVASAGDVNGDGYADVIVGATSGASGSAYLYLGSVTGSAAPSPLQSPAAQFDNGMSLASAGDVNGDGFADVIVGSLCFSCGSMGAAYLYLGGAGGLSAPSVVANDAGDTNASFGDSVASAGDVNGDGYADVIVGADGVDSYAGAAFVYLGGAMGLSALATALPSPGQIEGTFGVVVGSAGDLNSDGYADVIVGAETEAAMLSLATVYVYLGGPSGLQTTPIERIPDSERSRFAESVVSAGDLNRDGFGDLIVGATGSITSGGAAYVYFGSASGPADTATSLINPNSADVGFGSSVASSTKPERQRARRGMSLPRSGADSSGRVKYRRSQH